MRSIIRIIQGEEEHISLLIYSTIERIGTNSAYAQPMEPTEHKDNRHLVGQAFAIAMATTIFCMFLHFIISSRNEVLLNTNAAGTQYFLTLQLGDTIIPWSLGTVLIADLIAFSLALVGLYRAKSADEYVATKIVTGYLWFVVTIIVLSIVFGLLPPTEAFRRELASKLVPLVPFIAVKEWLFRRLHAVYDQTGRLVFEALAWNCRKDGLFNGFFLIAVISGLIGFSPRAIHYLLLFGKLSLLGSATVNITRQLRAIDWSH